MILVRLIDVFLKIIFECIMLFTVLVMRLCFSRYERNKDIICIIKRYQDTIKRHEDSNDKSYLKEVFQRPPVKYSYVLCVGDGESRVVRWAKNVINIDIPVFKFLFLKTILPHFSNSLKEFITLMKTIIFIKKKKIGCIEVDFPSNLIIRSIRLSYILKLKVVTKVIGNMDLIYYQTKFPIFFPFQIKNKFGDFIHQIYDNFISYIFFKSCFLVVGANRNNFDNALSKGACPSKSYLVRIKVDRGIILYKKLDRRDLQGFPVEGRVILLWSRIAQEMMVDTAVLALVPLLHKYKDLSFVLIGTGSEVEKIKEIAIENNIKDQIHLVGYQNRQYIKSAACYSEVILSPYGGSALVEAGLMECPVVAFDYEWQNELIIDNFTGYLSDFRDLEGIKNSVEKILLNAKESKNLASNFSQLTDKLFDPVEIENQIMKVYGRL